MNKLLLGLFLVLFLGVSSTTLSDTAPMSSCTFIAKTHRSIATARDGGTHPLILANQLQDLVEKKIINHEQLASMLYWIIGVYTSEETPQELYDSVYKQCMKAQGKTQV